MHIMLDLETWGLKPGCDLRSIGAVTFDPVKGVVNHYAPKGGSSQFYVATKNPVGRYRDGRFEEAKSGGGYPKFSLYRDPGTVEWWEKQSEEAKAAFADPVDIEIALHQFCGWFGGFTDDHEVKLWANGPHFDVVLLEVAMNICAVPVPWKYNAPRDFRTIVSAAGLAKEDYVNYGDAHNALHDAISQAMTVCKAYEKLGLQEETK